ACEIGAAFQALWGQWMVSAGLGRVGDARPSGGELLALAERTHDRALLLEAHHAMWATSFWLGELSAAERPIRQGISLYDPEQHRPLSFLYGGHDPGVCCRQFSIWSHWLSGRPTQAVTASQATSSLAEQLAHPPSLVQAMTWICVLRFFERNGPAAGYLSRRLIDLAVERELPPWRAAGMIIEGWSRAEGGDGGGGMAQICVGPPPARKE